MPTDRRDAVIRHIRTLLADGPLGGLPDGPLLERFLDGRDGSAEAAFEVLVRRHGPAVWHVCRDVLGDRHDAEDAFQATFLVLARRAGSIRRRESVGPWLHGVALRVAGHARLVAARRRRHERSAAVPEARPVPDADRPELMLLVREEVDRLPARFRVPIVLCHLEGLGQEQAARKLGWPLGTVRSRLARGRDLLRSRLVRRGLAPSLALLSASASSRADALPTRLIEATARAATKREASSPTIAALLERTMQAMFLSRVRNALIAPLALSAALGFVAVRPAVSQDPPDGEAFDLSIAKPADKSASKLLVAPRLLTASPGRGTAQAFALDWNGRRIEEGDRERIVETELCCAVVVGLLDHGAIRVNYAKALGVGIDRARPNYLRVDLGRQERTPGGDWSPWQPVDREASRLVLDNITEQEEEPAPPEVRLGPLVDIVPFFRKGSWRGIHVTKLATKGERADHGPTRAGRDPSLTEAPELFVRQIDFSVGPGRTYRYRARVVASDPSASPVDRPRELAGPWSEPTGAVAVPADQDRPDEPSRPTGTSTPPSPARKPPAPGSRPRG